MPSQSRIAFGQSANRSASNSNRRNSLSSAHSFEHNTDRWTGGSNEGMEHRPGDGEGMGEFGESLDAETRTENSRDGLLVPDSITTAEPSAVDQTRPSMTATKRFQSGVRRAILIRRNGQYDEKSEGGSRSREPGIDARKVELPDLQAKLVIQVVDYSREVCTLRSCRLDVC